MRISDWSSDVCSSDLHKTNIKIARIFNTYGPRMHPNDGRVVSNFIVHALMNEPIQIYGDGSQTRSFCFVDDLITGLVKLMDTPDDVSGPINIGNPHAVAIGELAERVIEMTGSASRVQFLPSPPDAPRHRRPDTVQAERIV